MRFRIASACRTTSKPRTAALPLLGRDVEAREIAERLLREHPASLAALEVRQVLQREEAELGAVTDTVAVDTLVTEPEPPSGRLTVELAEFRDRALALRFAARWQAEIPGLRIGTDRDEAQQLVYRVRTGSFVSRAQAETEIRRLARSHGLQGTVVESDD